MKKTKIISLFILILITHNALAVIEDNDLRITISINESFSEGEQIFFDYTITSTKDTNISFVEFVSCQDAPFKNLEIKEASIAPEQTLTGTYNYLTVTQEFEPQTCIAGISIENPIKLKKETEFTINTKPTLEFTIQTCNNIQCTQQTAWFLKEETIHIQTTSQIENRTEQATLTTPNAQTQQINLPHSFKATQSGEYTLTIKATAEGYKDNEKTTQFTVIGKKPEIKNLFNETDENEEKEQQTPSPEPNWNFYFLVSATSIIIAIIAIYNFTKIKKKK